MAHPFSYSNKRSSKKRQIIGRNPLLEAMKEGKEIDKILILKNAKGEEITTIQKIARERHIPVSKVPLPKLNRLSKANHQGVIAFAAILRFQPLQEIISQIIETGETPFIIVSDGITDTRNIGALARSAYCFGAQVLILPMNNSARITEEAIKTSAGALEHLSVCRVSSIKEAVDTLRLNGIQTLATNLSAAKDISEIDLNNPLALIMGSEDKGIGDYVLQKADYLVKIPMSDNFDSLNVSVAGGILSYEIFKQRRHVKK